MDGDWLLRENIFFKICRNFFVVFNEFFLNFLWMKEYIGLLVLNCKGEEIYVFFL